MTPIPISRRRLVVAAAALALAACSSTKTSPVDPSDKTVSLVYGYFDMHEAPSSLDWVAIKGYHDPKFGNYRFRSEKDGLFVHVAVQPGSYQVEKFGGTSGLFGGTLHEYNFGTRGRNDTAVRIVDPGVYFLGAYEYVPHKRGFFQQDEFEMRPIQRPTERELLLQVQRLLETDDALRPYTRQLALVKSRIADLPR